MSMTDKLFSFPYTAYTVEEKMERIFHSIRSLTDTLEKGRRLCLSCGKTATREALFDVGGKLILIERYCNDCVIKKE